MFNEVLKPLRPSFDNEKYSDNIIITVTVPPKDKKRRKATTITDKDVKLYMDSEGITYGPLIEAPAYKVSNATVEEERHTGKWVYKLRDLRVQTKKQEVKRKPARATSKPRKR